jgi:hypothetical protein
MTSTDNPPAKPTTWIATSPDGALRAECRGNVIDLVDVKLAERDREQRSAADPVNRMTHHERQALEAEQTKQWFAAAFHLGQLLKEKPKDEMLIRRQQIALKNTNAP